MDSNLCVTSNPQRKRRTTRQENQPSHQESSCCVKAVCSQSRSIQEHRWEHPSLRQVGPTHKESKVASLANLESTPLKHTRNTSLLNGSAPRRQQTKVPNPGKGQQTPKPLTLLQCSHTNLKLSGETVFSNVRRSRGQLSLGLSFTGQLPQLPLAS